MNAYAKLINALAVAIQDAKDNGLDPEHIAAALTKAAEIVEAEG